MCTVLLPPGGNPIAFNKYIIFFYLIKKYIYSYRKCIVYDKLLRITVYIYIYLFIYAHVHNYIRTYVHTYIHIYTNIQSFLNMRVNFYRKNVYV